MIALSAADRGNRRSAMSGRLKSGKFSGPSLPQHYVRLGGPIRMAWGGPCSTPPFWWIELGSHKTTHGCSGGTAITVSVRVGPGTSGDVSPMRGIILGGGSHRSRWGAFQVEDIQ